MTDIRFVPVGSGEKLRYVLLVDDIPVARMQWAFDVPEQRAKALDKAKALFGMTGTLEPIK